MVLREFRRWAPFKLDALGLVTILGAEEVDQVLGQLTQNRYTDWLPLLGAYKIANNHITRPIPGFTLYNITDGIVATSLAGWFARWLLCQDLTWCASTIFIMPHTMRQPPGLHVAAFVFGMVSFTPIVFSSIIRDWWGLANGISMLLSVIVRWVILGQNRNALDHAVGEAQKTSDQLVKVFLTIPNGKVVTILTTRGIVIDCLLTTPRPPNPRVYDIAQAIGWIAFGAHIVSLGMTTLFCQIMSICLLFVSTVLAVRQIGTDRYRIGQQMRLLREDSKERFREAAYARLLLTPEEENSMVQWHVFPQKSNKSWWDMYNRQCKEMRGFLAKSGLASESITKS
ncbi:MAG: hypothetical protein M1813_006324 [Trichoglossum hirsutum]|nr:MAG: hypothetical protein M1813_006324 [Trichoglossum hirsutum]